MFWADKFVKQIIASGKYKPYWVDDMKTPSGRIHVGSLRGVIVHDLLYKALLASKVKASYSFVFNDMDPMDGFPQYLPSSFKKYMGFPLFKIPSPEKGFKNFAQLYGQEFISVFNKLGAKPKILWSSEMYKKGKFNAVIKKALDNQVKVRELYKKISGYNKPKNWYPLQVICPQCGKVGTTQVNDWDGKLVSFVCLKNLVKWAEGCGFEGKISPFNGQAKLMWKMDWAAHWQVIRVTVEAAGKDHFSAGGSRDLSGAIAKKVFGYSVPFGFLYEWFLAKGGQSMSSSKGIGASAKEVAEVLPPEILRFLLVRTNYKKAISFDLKRSETIPDLFDDYDRCAREFFKKGKKSDLGCIFELSQVKESPKKSLFLPRFRDVANYLQMSSLDLKEKFSQLKGKKLNQAELVLLKRRTAYAQIWLEKFAPAEAVFQITSKLPVAVKNLSQKQRDYLKNLVDLLAKDWQPEKLQFELYELAKKMKLPVKDAFAAIYLALLGKKHGPKAAWLILSQKSKIIKRLRETIGGKRQ